mgnify:CR=1 FL=1
MFACRVYKLYNATKDYTQQTHVATIVWSLCLDTSQTSSNLSQDVICTTIAKNNLHRNE